MYKKHDVPNYLKLNISVPVKELQEDFNTIRQTVLGTSDYVEYTDSYVIDLTYLDQDKIKYTEVFAGSGTNRANANAKCNRLDIGKQTNPAENDKNHNAVKDCAINLFTVKWLMSLGPVSKITYATLKPGGWWPAHYDFNVDNACKINIPLYTNNECVSVSWNQKENHLYQENFKIGDVFLTNTGFKHTGFNWGNTERTYILATYNSQEILKYAN